MVGFKLKGKLKEGVTATDLVLTVTELMRSHKVVGKFVEFFGEGTASLSSRARVRQLKERFDEIWERSRVISEYRALGI